MGKISENSRQVKGKDGGRGNLIKNHRKDNYRQRNQEHRPPGMGPAPVVTDGRQHGAESQNGRPLVSSLDHQAQIQDNQTSVKQVLALGVRIRIRKQGAQKGDYQQSQARLGIRSIYAEPDDRPQATGPEQNSTGEMGLITGHGIYRFAS